MKDKEREREGGTERKTERELLILLNETKEARVRKFEGN